MTEDDMIPENSAQNEEPDTLTETDYVCGDCGRDDFDSAQELTDHMVACDGGDNDEGQ